MRRLLIIVAIAVGILVQSPAGAADGKASVAASSDGQFDCLIEPYQVIVVRTPVTGVIDKLFVTRGSLVKQGAPLVRLNSNVESAAADLSLFKSQMDGQLQSAESRLAHAQSKLRRKTDLAANNFASAQDREDAQADEAVARADVQAAREAKQLAKLEYAYAAAQLHLRSISSPINGVVTDQAMDVGDLAQPEDPSGFILKLAQIDMLRVKAIVPLTYYPRIKPGHQADVVPEKPLEGHYPARITVVDRVIDAASGTFQVRMDLPNPSGTLPAGIRCVARLW